MFSLSLRIPRRLAASAFQYTRIPSFSAQQLPRMCYFASNAAQ